MRVINLHLILGGDGDEKGVQRLVTSHSLEDRVDILGWVSGERQIAAFAHADIYALPSYNEGFPGSILEALAMGLPIVATPVGGVPELVVHGQNGFLVEPGNVTAIAHALEALAHDPDLRIKMGSISRRLATEKFDARAKLTELFRIYDELDHAK